MSDKPMTRDQINNIVACAESITASHTDDDDIVMLAETIAEIVRPSPAGDLETLKPVDDCDKPDPAREIVRRLVDYADRSLTTNDDLMLQDIIHQARAALHAAGGG